MHTSNYADELELEQDLANWQVTYDDEEDDDEDDDKTAPSTTTYDYPEDEEDEW